MLKKNYLKTIYCVFFVVLLTLGLSGCKVINTIDSLNGILEEQPPDSEVGTLLQAEYAFFAENYPLAQELYTEIREGSKEDIYVNQALYGLACVAIAGAKTTEELKQAFAQLQNWQEPGPDVEGYGENPKMIAMAVNKQARLLQCHPEIRYVTTKKEGELVNKYKEEIVELQSTIQKLEHQISVLEAIDQEIQEKRKPI